MSLAADKRWTIALDIDEHEGRTRAVARRELGQGEHLTGVGLARLNPADPDVPRIGDELAVARALSELTHRLFEVTAGDIERSTHQPVHTLH